MIQGDANSANPERDCRPKKNNPYKARLRTENIARGLPTDKGEKNGSGNAASSSGKRVQSRENNHRVPPPGSQNNRLRSGERTKTAISSPERKLFPPEKKGREGDGEDFNASPIPNAGAEGPRRKEKGG